MRDFRSEACRRSIRISVDIRRHHATDGISSALRRTAD
jgi:hypothetical protein